MLDQEEEAEVSGIKSMEEGPSTQLTSNQDTDEIIDVQDTSRSTFLQRLSFSMFKKF